MNSGRFHVVNLGLALGITWGAWLLILGLLASFGIWGGEAVKTLATYYPGYGATPTGSAIGAVWGLVCGFICGAVIALIYNFLQGRGSSSQT